MKKNQCYKIYVESVIITPNPEMFPEIFRHFRDFPK